MTALTYKEVQEHIRNGELIQCEPKELRIVTKNLMRVGILAVDMGDINIFNRCVEEVARLWNQHSKVSVGK